MRLGLFLLLKLKEVDWPSLFLKNQWLATYRDVQDPSWDHSWDHSWDP